jgi:hypothetical protein
LLDLKVVPDHLEYGMAVQEHISVPESKDPVAVICQPLVPNDIAQTFRVLRTVEFDD